MHSQYSERKQNTIAPEDYDTYTRDFNICDGTQLVLANPETLNTPQTEKYFCVFSSICGHQIGGAIRIRIHIPKDVLSSNLGWMVSMETNTINLLHQ